MATKPIRVCVKCGEEKTIIGRGMCSTCYYRAKRSGEFSSDPVKSAAMIASHERRKGKQSYTGNPGAERADTRRAGRQASAEDRRLVIELEEEDRELLARLTELARSERRTVGQQALWMIDRALEGRL